MEILDSLLLYKHATIKYESDKNKYDSISITEFDINNFNKNYSLLNPIGSYWRLIFISFSGVSIVCLLIASLSGNIFEPITKYAVIIICWIVFLEAAVYNFSVLRSLIKGQHTYQRNLLIWCKIFGIDYLKLKEKNNPGGLFGFNYQ